MKMECPRCQQDWVKKVHIGAAHRTVFLCYEREATWFCLESIEQTTFLELSNYLARLGLSPSGEVYETFADDEEWLAHQP